METEQVDKVQFCIWLVCLKTKYPVSKYELFS
jgi:hypothetical protein